LQGSSGCPIKAALLKELQICQALFGQINRFENSGVRATTTQMTIQNTDDLVTFW
jgi:hypothetical protein